MLTIRPARERGHFDMGWLDTWHTFSFGDYQDPRHEHFRALRVINEDRIRPGEGFGTHGHRDMEIVTWVLSGTLAHADSQGNRGTLVHGDVQRMTAGSGIRHSEFNGSGEEEVHLLQIWILPERAGLTPSYEQKHLPEAQRLNRLALLATRDGREGSLRWNQDVDLAVATLEGGRSLEHTLAPGRAAWIQVASGRLRLEGTDLGPGDGAAVSDVAVLDVQALETTEFLLFDLA